MVIVGRAINGVTLNGLEYLLDDKGLEKQFVKVKSNLSYLNQCNR